METKRAGIVFVGEFTGIGKETYPLHQLTIPGLFTTKYTKEISRCTWSWENHGNPIEHIALGCTWNFHNHHFGEPLMSQASLWQTPIVAASNLPE